MSCNIDCGAIPIKVPPADAFIPYVNRAEIAAEEAEKNAQQAKEAVESITDISNQVEQVQQLAQQAKESEVNANASAQIATNKANEVNENAQIASAKATEAAASASSIKGIENIVKNYKDEASVSATTAIDKANEASVSATKAKTSETSASASTQIATTKANEANASANIATDKASEASESAASAKISENKANEYAKEAKESVDSIDTSNLAKLIDNNTFKGINTFNGAVNVPTPTENSHAVNKEYLEVASVESATKAMQDSLGNNIADTYLNKKPKSLSYEVGNINNSISIEGQYTGLYYFNDSVNTIGTLLTINNGIDGGGKIITQIKNILDGKKLAVRFYRGVAGWQPWFYLAPLDSPAMTGKPTAPTAQLDINDTQIATCAFVKSQSASMDTSLLNILNQHYKKDSSGLIHQFIEVEATAEEIDVQFPISFPKKCLFVDVEILNPQKDSSVSNIKFETIEKTLDSVKLLKIGTGTPTISVMALGI